MTGKEIKSSSTERNDEKILGSTKSVNISSRIHAMRKREEFDDIASQIITEGQDNIIPLFVELHSKRMNILQSEEIETDLVNRDDWSHCLLSAFLWSQHDEGYILHQRDVEKNNYVFKTLNKLPIDSFFHFYREAKEHKCPLVLKALYLQGLWELHKLWEGKVPPDFPRPIDFAYEAIFAHSAAACWMFTQCIDPAIRGMLVTQHFRTASNIVKQIGQPELLTDILADIRRIEERLILECPHWALVLIECEIQLAEKGQKRNEELVSDERLKELKEVIIRIKKEIIRMGSMNHIEPKILEAQIFIEKLLGHPPDQREVSLRYAQMYETQVERISSRIMQSSLWKNAAINYQQAGFRDDAARCKKESRIAIQLANEEGEFQEIRAPLEISKEKIDMMIEPFFQNVRNSIDVLINMSSRLFVPSLEYREVPRKIRHRSIASQLLNTIPIVDDRTLARISPDTPEQEKFEDHRALLQEVLIMSEVMISGIFEKLKRDMKLNENDIIGVFYASEFIVDEDFPFLKNAAKHYCNGDLIAMIHVLVPRIEQMIRRILKVSGTDITAIKDGALRDRTLGEIIRAGEADGTLPIPLARLLQSVLSEEWGLNLRNRLAHGLLKEEECSQANADRVLHTAILLANIRLLRENGNVNH